MNYKIFPPSRTRTTTVRLPLSKSISNRVLMMRKLTPGNPKMPNLASCDDTFAMIKAFTETSAESINVGAAGTAMRFLTAYFASFPGRTVFIDGSERMRQRPIGPLVDALRSLGADIEYTGEEGYPPLRIKGTQMKGGKVELDANISSQYVSALMMIGPAMDNGLTITLKGRPASMPYIIMTLMMMLKAGIQVMLHDDTITIAHGPYRDCDFKVEADWSAASFWYGLVAVGATDSICLEGLEHRSIQGDSSVVQIYNRLGVATDKIADRETVLTRLGKTTSCLETDLNDNPDLAQIIAVTCCLKYIPFRLTGLNTLPLKETDRLMALKTELHKLGFDITIENNDSLIWNGEITDIQPSPRICTYNDHRMAMSFAAASVMFPGIMIENAEVVNKSYPKFWDDLTQAGFKVVKA